MFEQDSAHANQSCKMVAFLDCEMRDFVPMLLSADTINISTFFISKPDLVHDQSRVATDSTS